MKARTTLRPSSGPARSFCSQRSSQGGIGKIECKNEIKAYHLPSHRFTVTVSTKPSRSTVSSMFKSQLASRYTSNAQRLFHEPRIFVKMRKLMSFDSKWIRAFSDENNNFRRDSSMNSLAQEPSQVIAASKMVANIMRSNLSPQDKEQQALRRIHQLRDEGLKPNAHIYTTLIQGLAKSRNHGAARTQFANMKAQGLRPNELTYNSILNGYLKEGDMERADALIEEMRNSGTKANAATYNMRITRMLQNGEDVNGLLQEMKAEHVAPTTATYNALISHYYRIGDINSVDWTFNEMKQQGLKPDVFTYNEIINYHMKSGNIQEINNILKQMASENLRPDPVIYTTIMTGYLNAGNWEAVQFLRNQMKNEGVEPDLAMYHLLIRAHLKERNFQEIPVLLQAANKIPRNDTNIYVTILSAYFNAKENLDPIMEQIETANLKDKDYIRILAGLIREKSWNAVDFWRPYLRSKGIDDRRPQDDNNYKKYSRNDKDNYQRHETGQRQDERRGSGGRR